MNKIGVIILFCISLRLEAQNLVLNPSFEDTVACATSQGFPHLPCSIWFMPTNGSVDYFSISYCGGSNVPANQFGYQYPRLGNSYCGFSTYNDDIPPAQSNYREYLEGILSDTMQFGHNYCISFYIVNANITKYFTSSVGIYFSVDSVFDYGSDSTLPYAPQIINNLGIIYDTLNWVQISGVYTAQGGEKFITIGNFNDDLNTPIDSGSTSNPNIFSYFFIDDVSVVDCTVGISEIEKEKYNIQLFPNPAKKETTYSIRLNENGNLKLFSTLGVQILSYKLFEGENKRYIDLEKLLPGIYILETREKEKIIDRRKLVVIK